MVNQALLFDKFNNYYKRAEEAGMNGDNTGARRFYTLASETMAKLAQVSEGDLKRARFERAERLLEKAKPVEVDRSVKRQKQNGIESVSSNDDSGTVFEPATIPDVSFDDVAGHTDAKENIISRIINPLKFKDLYQAFKKKPGGGLCLWGPPGGGKTMMAKATAKEAGAKFYNIKCSDIVSKWFGESERNIRSLFETARQDEVAIIFFDEAESLFAKRGGRSTVMNRLIPELLSQTDGFTESNNVLLLMASTNRPYDLDSAFLRPGRFSELIYIGLPDHAARKHIIQKAYENVRIDPYIDFDILAADMDGYNGADVVEFCDRSKDYPIKRSILNGGYYDNEMIMLDDIKSCAASFIKSVQSQDIEALENFRKQYQ